MISLARVSANMGRHYYKTENYYANEKCVENSEWYGIGAADLGLSGRVDSQVFQALLEGRSVKTGASLTREHENHGTERRAGIDLTFSAPKSVSLACLVGGDDRLAEAHKKAVDAALAVCENRYSLTRTGGKYDRKTETTGNIIAAKFHHDTSRAKDPQLHTHCVVINAVKRADGEWRSLHNDGIFSNSKILGLVYQNELARSVATLGYQVEVKANGTFEIAGYSEDQLRTFSKRRAKIEELGAENQREARLLVKVDRQKKGPEIPRDVLQEGWRKEAQEQGIVHPRALVIARTPGPRQSPFEMVKAATKHATEHDVTFKREQLEKFALENGLGDMSWKDLQGEIALANRRGDLVLHSPNAFTTRACLQTEGTILSVFRGGQTCVEPICQGLPAHVERNTLGLTEGQREAVAMSLQTRNQFVAWQGVAGSGKTFALNVIREVSLSQGVTVRGFAPSAEAAKVLETEARIPSSTVAGLLTQSRQAQSEKKNELWIVDEAGLLSALDCKELLERAQQEKARVVLVGDTRQLSSVGAGNPFKLLQENGIQTAHLTESRRQKKEDLKAALSLLAAGKTVDGLMKIEQNIVEFRREQTRIDHVKDEYLKLSDAARTQTLILAGTNRERDLLTESIRTALKEQNKLGAKQQMTTLRARDLTPEELRMGTKIEVGDVLVFHRSYKTQGIERNSPCEVLKVGRNIVTARTAAGQEIAFSPARQPAFLAFEKRKVEVAVGDRIRWTRNDRTLGVRNGQDATVVAVNADAVTIANKDGKPLTVRPNKAHHLDHNYVNTVYSSQGKTCENVIVSTDNTFGKEAMYVAVSRAKSNVTIFTEDKKTMLNLATESRAKISAVELVPQVKNTNERSVSEAPAQRMAQTRTRSRGR